MKTDVVSITSHANTKEKINILRNCIEKFKSYGYDIILNSHISLPEEIINLVDYFIYDKNNSLITWQEFDTVGGAIVFWMSNDKFYIEKKLDFNHGFAVLKMLKNSAALAASNGYKNIHFVDYDYIINDPELLKKHSDKLNSHDCYFYNWGDINAVNSAFFSFDINKFLKIVDAFDTKEDYCRNNITILENKLKNLIDIFSINSFIDDIENIKINNQIDIFNQLTLYGLYQFKNYDVRVILCSNFDKFYIFLQSSKADKKNKLILSYNGNRLLLDIEESQIFYELPNEFIDNGFQVDFSKKKINLIYDKSSNISVCEIRDLSVVKKIEL